jgi:hypothetical protein
MRWSSECNVKDLFNLFEQRGADRTGLGLGLAFSRWAVEANQGRIYARNLPDVGCVFTVDLPRCPVPALAIDYARFDASTAYNSHRASDGHPLPDATSLLQPSRRVTGACHTQSGQPRVGSNCRAARPTLGSSWRLPYAVQPLTHFSNRLRDGVRWAQRPHVVFLPIAGLIIHGSHGARR